MSSFMANVNHVRYETSAMSKHSRNFNHLCTMAASSECRARSDREELEKSWAAYLTHLIINDNGNHVWHKWRDVIGIRGWSVLSNWPWYQTTPTRLISATVYIAFNAQRIVHRLVNLCRCVTIAALIVMSFMMNRDFEKIWTPSNRGASTNSTPNHTLLRL